MLTVTYLLTEINIYLIMYLLVWRIKSHGILIHTITSVKLFLARKLQVLDDNKFLPNENPNAQNPYKAVYNWI